MFPGVTGRFSSILGAALLIAAVQSIQATTVTVQETSVTPAQIVNIQVQGFYSGGAYAGVVNMLVDGKTTQGFCIDPFHFSSMSPLQYEVVSLSDAPKDLSGIYDGPMGTDKADQIQKLWAMAYLPNSPTWGASAAAAMQIAIWEIVAGDKFTVIGNDYGAGALLNSLSSYTGPKADLVGLTGPGQDYVVKRVPEAGATLALLSIGVGLLTIARRYRH